MKRVEFTVDQRRLNQDLVENVPDEVWEKGVQAIKDWLVNTGKVDDALDYAETETKILVFNYE